MYELLSVQKTIGRGAGARNRGVFGEECCVGLRHASQCDGDKAIPFEHPQPAKGRLAKIHRFFEHRPKHRLQFAGRTRNDLQHLGGRGLVQGREKPNLRSQASFDRSWVRSSSCSFNCLVE